MLFDVIIVGGGLAGLSLACALRPSRLKIALVENLVPAPVEGWDSRIYALSPATASFLRQIGVWKHLDSRRIAPIHAMQIYGDDGARLDFSTYESGIDELGWILESSLMGGEMWENVKRQDNLTLFCPATPMAMSLDEDAATLSLADGRMLSARLLVGADGRNSWVRQSAGLPAEVTPYGEMGVVANFACEMPHRGTAYQWFRDDGVLAWLPLAGNDGTHRISMVWSTPDTHAGDLLSLSSGLLCERVARAGRHALGRLELITPPTAFPLQLMRVPHSIGQRLALIGDAAHGIHPLSGHGINLGFMDASVLGKLLCDTPEWQDIGSNPLLRRYQRARREETILMQYTTHTLRQLFRETLSATRILRNAGMSVINDLPVIKNLLVRYAIGT